MKKLAAALFALILLLGACKASEETPSTPLPEYQIANFRSNLYLDNEYCTYSILISPDCSDNELMAVARFLLDDGYYQHNFLFFRKVEELNGMYTVARIKEEDDGSLTLNRTGGGIKLRDRIYPDDASSVG